MTTLVTPGMNDENGGGEPLPWATEPGPQGHMVCGWCDRAIYRPALPCSVRPVPGLLSMPTQPGQGERCKYEFATRVAKAAE